MEFQAFGGLESEQWISHKLAAFLAFLLFIGLQLGPLVFAAGYSVRSSGGSFIPLILALLFLLSTFFCYYEINYCMRGSIFPIFVLMFLATPAFGQLYDATKGRWLRIGLGAYFLGGILEYMYFDQLAIETLRASATPFNARALASNVSAGNEVSVSLAEESERNRDGWQILEKNKPTRKTDLGRYDLVLMHPDNTYRITFSRLLGEGSQH